MKILIIDGYPRKGNIWKLTLLSRYPTADGNRNLEVTLMEYGVVVAVIFVIAIGIYASLKNKKKR